MRRALLCLVLVSVVTSANAARIRPYVFTSQKGEKVDAELGTFAVPALTTALGDPRVADEARRALSEIND